MRRTIALLSICGIALASPLSLDVEDQDPIPPPDDTPDDAPDGTTPSTSTFTAGDVARIDKALRDAGAYRTGMEQGAFLSHLIEAIADHRTVTGSEPGPDDARDLFDAACVFYGGPEYPKTDDTVIAAFCVIMFPEPEPES